MKALVQIDCVREPVTRLNPIFHVGELARIPFSCRVTTPGVEIMTSEYLAYLDSPEWKAKRHERLQIAQYRCSACGGTANLHVHHLTYERIFREEMADLLPLCEKHHTAVERLKVKGKLPRKGNVLFLATETIRLLLSPSKQNKKRDRKQYCNQTNLVVAPPVVKNGEVLLTRNMIHSAGRSGVGFNRKQLCSIGVAWPPKKGWLSKLIGTSVPSDAWNTFVSLRREVKP